MKTTNWYNGRSTEFKKPGWFHSYNLKGELISSSQWLIEAEDDIKVFNGGKITFVECYTQKSILIKEVK